MKGGEGLVRGVEPLDRNTFLASLIGPSGVGKSTLAELLQKAGVVTITPTIGTRPLRKSEKYEQPFDRIFESESRFDQMDGEGLFLAKRSMYGARYAVPFIREAPDGRIPLMVLKPCFIEEVKAYYPHLRVYHIDARAALLPGRMRARGQDEADIANRMWEHGVEVIDSRRLADCTIDNSGEVGDALQQLTAQLYADYSLYQSEVTQLEPVRPAIPLLENGIINLPNDTPDSMENFA